MSGRKWQPGDVGITAGDPGRDPQRFIVQQGPKELRFVYGDGSTLLHPPREDARPLVVIDPEDRQQAERLSVRFHNEFQGERRVIEGGYVDAMQAALREFADPKPRIEEPTGLGAVVEDEDGSLLIRNAPHGSRPWVTIHGATFEWADIDPVRVLSEGVTS